MRIAAACGALALVHSGDSNAGLVTHSLDACDHEVGTDASSVAQGATLAMMSRDGETDSFVYQPAVIQGLDPLQVKVDPLTGCGQTIGSATAVGEHFQSYLGGNAPSGPWKHPHESWTFSALRVDFTPLVREVSITGFETYSDGITAWLFGPDDQLLDLIIFDLVRMAWDGDENDSALLLSDRRATISIPTGMPLAYMVMGSWTDVPAYFTSISYSVRVLEPGTVALFGLGLVGMGFARRRKAS